MPHTTEDPELGEVKKDPRDTLIEALLEYYKITYPSLFVLLKGHKNLDDLENLKSKIQAAEKAIKGG